MMKQICSFSASNSSDSINRFLLTCAVKKIHDQKVNSVDIRDYPMPIYSTDLESDQGFPESVKQLRDDMLGVDAYIIAIPEHNGSMPAVFKNMIDWLSRVTGENETIFSSKPVLLLSTSPGENGGATNLNSLMQLMPWWGASVVKSYSLGNFYKNTLENDLLLNADKKLKDEINAFMECI